MKVEFKDDKEMQNEALQETVETNNEMKSWLVNYVGEKHEP